MDPEEQELLNDYRYRNYSSVIEKALRNFESSSEWADLISSLGKLNKVCGAGSVCTRGVGRWAHSCPFIVSRTCLFNITLHADYSHQIRRTAANLSPKLPAINLSAYEPPLPALSF